MLVYIINVLTDETVDVLISGTPWWEEASAVVVADRTKLLSTMLFGWDVSATCVLAASDVVLVFAVVPVAAVLLLAVVRQKVSQKPYRDPDRSWLQF